MAKGAAALQSRFREGLALHRQGDLAAAERIYREALQSDPNHFDATHMLGVVLLQRGQTEQGVVLVRRAIALNGRIASAHNNLGKGLLDLKRPKDALPCFERAVALDPKFVEAHISRAGVLVGLRRAEEALASYRSAVALRPDNAELQRNCGNLLAMLRRHDEAFAAYDRAFALKPDLAGIEGHRLYAKINLCDWSNWEDETARLVSSVREGHTNTQPFILLAVPSSPADQLRCARSWVAHHFPQAAPRWQGEHYRHDRIRLAYVSADFREHAASLLMAGMFECHDKSRFEVTAISLAPQDASELGARVRRAFERFVDASALSDDEIADLIKTLEIDIAVDLMGFTTNSRTGIFARRPAPVQAHYMGFPGTMGAPYIDYVVADRTVIPDCEREFLSEKIAALPNTYLVNDRGRAIAERPFSRSELGLPDRAFVYCCFNSNHKITPNTFTSWRRILRQVEHSVLWLLQSHAKAAENLRQHAVANGIDPNRLVFAQRIPPAEHLARHRAADLFLDTQPYNAHTTAADALWAGLPVLTLMGETFAGRVAASLLNAVGLPGLVTTSQADYERLAVALATEPDKLTRIRTKLADNRLTTPLFDTELFTRHIEVAFLEMYRRHQDGLPPDHFAVADLSTK
jgi:protein O-GlcNAc transferase